MSFNVALQCQSTPQSPTCSSISSTDDDVNNPAARVYFGPIQSPERLLIATQATHKRNNLQSIPVRRSPRLSAHQSSQQRASPSVEEGKPVGIALREKMGPDVASPSATPTPDEDSTQDDIDLEPASALATKISRAHDNPSPPPKMQPLVDPIPPAPTNYQPLSDSLVSKVSDLATVDEPLLIAQAPVPSPASPEPVTPIDHRLASPLASSSTDLIVFDDGHLPDVPKVAPTAEPFPDLLAPTPLRKPGPFLRGLESISRTTLSSTRIFSPANEETERDHASTDVVTTPPVSNSPATESPVQLRRSPRLSSPRGFLTSPRTPKSAQKQTSLQSVPANQSGLISRNEVDLPDVHTSQVDTHSSETVGRSVVTESPCQVRELGSLSPVSEGVLHNLLSTTEAITTAPLDQIPVLSSVIPANQQSRDRPSTPERRSSPEQPSGAVAIHNVQRPPPERSPWRSHIANLGSPSKFGLTSTLHDPNRTPARRIPIREAIAQRSASPRKDYSSGPSTGTFGGPVFARSTQEGRTRSPVRPPPDVAHHATVVSSGIARPTALASPGKVRNGSEEPQFLRGNHLGRPFQRSASDSEISSPSKIRRNLAFPIRPAVDARLPGTIPEEHEADPPMKSTQSKPPLKSALRQPSSLASSRIPRIGAKPYARPQENEKQRSKGKEPVHKLLMTKRPTPSGTTLTKPVRLVRSVNATGSGSSSEDLADSHAATLGVPSSSQTSTSALFHPSPSLKRKRSAKMLSPPAAQPTFARLVTPTSGQNSSSVLPAPPQDSGVVVKKAKIGHVRTVGGDTTTQMRAARSPDTQASVVVTAKTSDQPRTNLVSDPSDSQMPPPSPPPTLPPTPHTNSEEPSPSDAQTEPASPRDIQPTTLPSEPNEGLSSSPSLPHTTRVTRSRRNPQPTGDVFGLFRPLQPRRRRPVETPGGGTFSSMSALALKALTTSNTAKNQHNLVAVLETEVIRKPGNRPGSPTTGVKSIEEKRKLEQGQGRKERAERRARRSSEQPLDDSSFTSEDEESLPLGPDGQPQRHRRGAGDEEDYKSPERAERPEKKPRIGEAAESEEEVGAKTVKWDRGLFTRVYFDDLPLQSQARDKSQTPAKDVRGALAGSAKALHLDSLGNLVNATSPLKDLVQENVVIKKYVYDDDAEAVDIDVPVSSAKGKGKKLRG